jgi:hypothetical protein
LSDSNAGPPFPLLKIVKLFLITLLVRAKCAARAALQMGCVAKIVATEFIVFFSSCLFPLSVITFLPEGVVLGS